MSGNSFRHYTRQNQQYLWLAVAASLFYFILIRWLYPVPSYFADSFTFVGAAKHNQPVTFRPIMYSKLIQLFKLFSTSELALIAGQYFSTVLANLFLFYTCSWLFQLSKYAKWILFGLLIVHPFHAFSSNYVSSDPFFTSFTVAWFTLLLWIMYRPTWYVLTAHLLLLVLLFMLRYNAIYFPILTAIATLLSALKWWKKAIVISLSVISIVACIEVTSIATKSYVGTKVFSAFSGWQFANNALNIMRYEKVDTAGIADPKVKELVRFNQHYFDTTSVKLKEGATAWFMWYPTSPLKQYMKVYDAKAGYFRTWNALGPIYGKFGKTIILQNTGSYVKHFVIPNTTQYFLPRTEIYETYFEDVDTVAAVAQKYFGYKSNKVSPHHPTLYTAIFEPWPYLFLFLNVSFLIGGCWYFATKAYRKHTRLVNQFIVLVALYFLANSSFIVLLAPSVLRYHLPVLTLLIPVVIFLIEVIRRKNQAAV